MRLIDADEMAVQESEAYLKVNTREDVSPITQGINSVVHRKIQELIANTPTIDPASLRPKGEWIDKPTGAYGRWQSWCSHCGKHSGIGGIESNRHKDFCPNCGADMRPKED